MPKQWKIAHVIPCHKKTDKHDSSNCKQVSLVDSGQGCRKELSWTHLVDKMAKNAGKNCPGHI